MRKNLKKIFDTHWNCLPWFVCGASILIKGDIGRLAYGLAWATVLVMIWRYCPTVNFDKLNECSSSEENKEEIRR